MKHTASSGDAGDGMNHFLGAEEQFTAIEESCGGVGDVSRTNKGRTGEIDVVTEIRLTEIEPTLKSYIIYSQDGIHIFIFIKIIKITTVKIEYTLKSDLV